MTSRVLVVCTANVCRSPMGEALLATRLADRGITALVTSAGTQAVDLPVDPEAVRALRGLGIEIGGHVPRRFDKEILDHDGADLIITMTREHLRTVATRHRSSWARTFTLRELVRRAEGASAAVTWADWLAELSIGRKATDLLGDDPRDDIADPYGRGGSAVAATANEIDTLVSHLSLLAPWPTA